MLFITGLMGKKCNASFKALNWGMVCMCQKNLGGDLVKIVCVTSGVFDVSFVWLACRLPHFTCILSCFYMLNCKLRLRSPCALNF